MTIRQQLKLKELGLSSQTLDEAFNDLIFLCEILIEKDNIKEEAWFKNELARLKKPTN